MFHPAAILLVWTAAVLALQFFGWSALALVAAGLFLGGRAVVLARWWRLLRRARWLLLTLWLILAYGTPGEVWFPADWAPTDSGVELAGLHVLRLGLLLGLLAALFETLDQKRLVSGLWALTRPISLLGIAADRLVVRLALVFDFLEHTPPAGNWRHLLRLASDDAPGPAVVSLERFSPDIRDAGLAFVAGVVLLALLQLP